MSRLRAFLPLPEGVRAEDASRAQLATGDLESLQRRAVAWAQELEIGPARASGGVRLLVIDAQVDFSFPNGALFVAGRSGKGAVEANQRLVAFLYRNLHLVDEVTCTLDTHHPFQIFFPSAHLDVAGQHPATHTVIAAEDYAQGRYRPNPAMARHLGVSQDWLVRQFLHYCQELERRGKHQLYLWPYHCLLGAEGHRLVGALQQAVHFHGFARGARNRPVTKGDNPLSERYSVFSEEVTSCWDGGTIAGAGRNQALLDELLAARALIVAGLASSHCVRESVEDLLREIQGRDPSLAGRVYLLEDCTAPVVIPGGPDFTDDAAAAFARFEAAGMHRVRSSEPVSSWPAFPIP